MEFDLNPEWIQDWMTLGHSGVNCYFVCRDRMHPYGQLSGVRAVAAYRCISDDTGFQSGSLSGNYQYNEMEPRWSGRDKVAG